VQAPVGQWVDLDEAILGDFNNVQVTSLGPLTAAAACQDSLDLEFGVGTLCRLNLGNVVVKFIVGVPELVAMLSLEVVNCITTHRLVHMDRGSVAPSYPVNQSVCLVEVIQRVQKDQVDVVLQGSVKLGKHVHRNKTSEAKSSCLVETWQSSDGPF
jgi:hypothetical protein